ncbi:MAG: hypothetical protein K0V04_42215 [Deltaproteobacteria bacterium]|nr:hypothetical protein [Deltaproteobacteria bacterium]
MTDTPDPLDEAIAALPRSIEPTTDLWPAISERITAPAPRRRWWRPAIGIAMAAGLAGLWWSTTSPDPQTGNEGATELAQAEMPEMADDAPGESRSAVDAAEPQPEPERTPLLAQEPEYWLALADLDSDRARHRVRVDSKVADVFDTHFADIDLAIEHSRGALSQHPDDPHLQQMLDHAYRQKLGLLKQLADAARRL